MEQEKSKKATEKENVYLICDASDEKASQIDTCPNIGVEHLGLCYGRIVRENGDEIGCHTSSTYGWLRSDLISKLENPERYNIIDLIGKEVPEFLKQQF